MSVRVGSRRRRRGYGRNRQGAAGPTGIRPQAPLRPAVFAPSQRQRLRKQDSGGSSALNTFAHLGFVARGIAYIVIGGDGADGGPPRRPA